MMMMLMMINGGGGSEWSTNVMVLPPGEWIWNRSGTISNLFARWQHNIRS